MRVDLFDFDLPPALIAERPAEPRESARLLRVTADGLADRHVGDLPDLLSPGDLLVLNDTRVIPARLAGQRGAVRIAVQLHRQVGRERWRAFAKPGKRLKPGDRIAFAEDFTAAVAAKLEGGEVELAFDRAGPELAAAIAAHGAMPLPPYIKRPADAQDRRDYQTMFAAKDGAVAAPTAALHFTPDLVERLRARGVGTAFVTLHVGAGTFLPVKAEDTRDHRMHAESGEIEAAAAAAIARARAAGGRIVAVGTTALRILEATAAPNGAPAPFVGDVDIFIAPGYRFRAVDRLLTNFHLPRSTLFMLVAAFAGLDRMRQAYAHAIAAGYRFYSYGDCCLLDRLPE